MGGWDEGARQLGIHAVGIDCDLPACRVNRAAGGTPILAKVDELAPERFGPIDGIIASPPCPDFSMAGKRAGIDGESGKLIFEVMRWTEALRPRWIACEQVPPALEWWERFATELEAFGYGCWAGLINAADLGVPQTRTRAFLLASLEKEPRPPEPTHARDPHPVLFGDELLPWVSMAEALGWATDGEWRWAGTDSRRSMVPTTSAPAPTLAMGHTVPRVGFPRRDDRDDSEDGYRDRASRGLDEPAFALTGKARSWQVVGVNTGRGWKPGGTRGDAQTVLSEQDAPTIDGRGRWHALVEAGVWPEARPATTVAGDPRLGSPCHHDEQERQMAQSIRVTIEDALVLQGFRSDYPVGEAGTRTKQFKAVGNAVCPPVARAVLEQLL
jgi:DNA (cytosine-5)-methyltransferase 1